MTIESSDPHFIVDYSKKIKNKKYPNFLVIIYKVKGIFYYSIGLHAFQACALGHYATSPKEA